MFCAFSLNLQQDLILFCDGLYTKTENQLTSMLHSTPFQSEILILAILFFNFPQMLASFANTHFTLVPHAGSFLGSATLVGKVSDHFSCNNNTK